MNQQRAAHDEPVFPAATVTWLVGATARSVVVTSPSAAPDPRVVEAVVHAGHDVSVPDLPLNEAALPHLDQSVDVVVVTGALPDDLGEVVRVLRPGGQLGLVRTGRDHRIPWARKLDLALEAAPLGQDPSGALVASGQFGFVSDHENRFWQTVTNGTLADAVAPDLEGLDDELRTARLTAARALYDDYGRGADGMQLPSVARCLKATVLESAYIPARSLDEREASDRAADGKLDEDGLEETQPYQFDALREGRERTTDSSGASSSGEASGTVPTKNPGDGPQDGSDSSLLLIDFR